MVSQRGIMNLIHTDAQRDAFTRRGNGMILNGADAVLVTAAIRAAGDLSVPEFRQCALPDQGCALAQKRGGTVRHDAVAWGYARGADMPRR